LIGKEWELALGLFRSQAETELNHWSFLFDLGREGKGDYYLQRSPPRLNRSTSGEVRLSRLIQTENFRHNLYASKLIGAARARSAAIGSSPPDAITSGELSQAAKINRPANVIRFGVPPLPPIEIALPFELITARQL
jgi:hypothetical protein